MFNKDFYPTPASVIDTMLAGIDLNGLTIFEPSAGSGAILDYCKLHGAKDLLCCENDPDLARIAATKGRMIADDFLTVTPEQISHIDMIVMNPPFSADEHHINHAFEIAPGGCLIVSLCNYATYDNAYSQYRSKLKGLIKDHGSIENLGDVFSNAERTTGINIGLIRLNKPKAESDAEFDGYFDLSEEFDEQGNGIMTHNEVREIVNRYVGAVKMFNEVDEANRKINTLIKPISNGLGIKFGAISSRNNICNDIDREVFKKELQKSAWRAAFAKLKMERFVTQSIQSDINKFVEQQTSVPFTMKNIYKMVELIAGTHESRMNRVLVEAFEHICSFSSENTTAGEKWKTNSDYKINKRFIIPGIGEYDTRWPSDTVKIRCGYGYQNRVDDIIKALCLLTGDNYDKLMKMEYKSSYGAMHECHKSLYNFFSNTPTPWGQWVEYTYFRVRCYKKGTMHAEFKDDSLLDAFNRKVAQIKGWRLPTKTGNNVRRKKTGVEVYA